MSAQVLVIILPFLLIGVIAGICGLVHLWRSRQRIVERGGPTSFACTRCGRTFSSWQKDDSKKHDCVEWIAERFEYYRKDTESRLGELDASQKLLRGAMPGLERTRGRLELLEARFAKHAARCPRDQQAAGTQDADKESVTGEEFLRYLPGALAHLADEGHAPPDAVVLNPRDRETVSMHVAPMLLDPAKNLAGGSLVTHLAGLRVYSVDWVEPGKMIVLWREKGRLERAEIVNLCC